jgi:hypothetical protein
MGFGIGTGTDVGVGTGLVAACAWGRDRNVMTKSSDKGKDDPPCEVRILGACYPLADKQRIFDFLGYI